MLQTPDGNGRLELFEYIQPDAIETQPAQPNEIGMHRVAFSVDNFGAALAIARDPRMLSASRRGHLRRSATAVGPRECSSHSRGQLQQSHWSAFVWFVFEPLESWARWQSWRRSHYLSRRC